jgi:hypothetical protein
MDENKCKIAFAPLLIGACLLCLALASCGITTPAVPATQPAAAKLAAPPVYPRETPTRQPENIQISGSTKEHFDLGMLYYGRGQLDKAIDQFAYVLEQDPFDLNARTNLGDW